MKKILCLLLVCVLLAGCGTINININDSDSKDDTKQTETKKDETKQTDTKKDATPTRAILVCSSKTENEIDFVTDMAYYFENDKIVQLTVKYTYDLSGYTEQQRKAFATASMCSMPEMEEKLGMTNCKEGLSGTDYVVTGNANKLMTQVIGTLSTLKTAFENEGWTCKVQ